MCVYKKIKNIVKLCEYLANEMVQKTLQEFYIITINNKLYN